MCIRDSIRVEDLVAIEKSGPATFEYLRAFPDGREELHLTCLLYTSDAADERSSVDLGGRRIIKKKRTIYTLYRTGIRYHICK